MKNEIFCYSMSISSMKIQFSNEMKSVYGRERDITCALDIESHKCEFFNRNRL